MAAEYLETGPRVPKGGVSAKIRVLVVDDSAFFRGRIVQALQQSEAIEVVGQAADGREAVVQAERLRPDLITMDVEMPVLDGIAAVRQIMARRRTDIIMFSALTRDGARATLDALEAGAADFLPKHGDPASGTRQDAGEQLRARVLALAARRHTRVAPAAPVAPRPPPRVSPARPTAVELVVIGASTGGPVALQQVLLALPAQYPLPVLVAVHMPGAFTTTFAERLNSLCQLTVAEARDGDLLRAGRVLVAPGGRQTLVEGRPGALRVALQDVPDQLYKPSVDLCFGSAARVLGPKVLAIVLTGMGADGRQGARLLKQAGAQLWSQDAASCVVYGMPQAVEQAGLSDQVLPLEGIGPALAGLQVRGA